MTSRERIETAWRFEEPDRVPFMPLVHYFVAKYAGITFQEAMHDMDKLETALEKMVHDMQLDCCLESTFRLLTWAPPLKSSGYPASDVSWLRPEP